MINDILIYGGALGAAAAFTAAVIIYFKLGISRVIAELTGRARKRELMIIEKDVSVNLGKRTRSKVLSAELHARRGHTTNKLTEVTTLLQNGPESVNDIDTCGDYFYNLEDIVIIHTNERITKERER